MIYFDTFLLFAHAFFDDTGHISDLAEPYSYDPSQTPVGYENQYQGCTKTASKNKLAYNITIYQLRASLLAATNKNKELEKFVNELQKSQLSHSHESHSRSVKPEIQPVSISYKKKRERKRNVKRKI